MQRELTGTCSISATFAPDAEGKLCFENVDTVDLCFSVLGYRFIVPVKIWTNKDLNTVIDVFALADREAAEQMQQDAAEDSAMRR